MSENIDELLSDLEDLGENIVDALEKGVLQACQKIQREAKELVPVRSSRLKNSITAQTEQENGKVTGVVGTNVKYAPFVEFGTGPAGAASPKTLPEGINISYRPTGWAYHDGDGFRYTNGQPAQPFLYPAFKQNESHVLDIIANVIGEKIKKVMG